MNIPQSCTVHATAVIEDGAVLGENIQIGPYV
ncbi:MAG: acyl-[acyl-carrier-protein]--UDP-N-acetylglucosamine O-acyltransferase, partial [Thermodesulfatator sp.]